MKVDPEIQARLLDVAELDSALARLTHQRRTLPELADIARMEEQEDTLAEDVVLATTQLGDARRELSRAEAAVQQVRDRAARNDQRLASGQGTAKDLQALQQENEALAKRQAVLEDEELAVMERVEGLEATEARVLAVQEEHRATLAELRAIRDERQAELDREQEELAAGRPDLLEVLPDELVRLYEQLRERTGLGAALMTRGRCGGCRLDLNAVELNRIRNAPEDEVVRCEECGRIMVRTGESGL